MNNDIILSDIERIVVLAIAKLTQKGRPTGHTFTARALAGWMPADLPRHIRSERAVGPVLDLMQVEPNPRTSRRATADLLAHERANENHVHGHRGITARAERRDVITRRFA